jgi:hypothetical protein
LIGDVDILPDLESLSDSFITPLSVDGVEDGDESPRVAPRNASLSASKGDPGDFDSKEMAMAIQTILKREEKG